MDVLRQFIVMMFGICLSITVTVGVMVYGWGLEPKSWWWIIGMYFIGQMIAQSIVAIGKADPKND